MKTPVKILPTLLKNTCSKYHHEILPSNPITQSLPNNIQEIAKLRCPFKSLVQSKQLETLLIFLPHSNGIFFENNFFLLVLSEYSNFKIVFFVSINQSIYREKNQIIHIIILALLSKINQSHPAQMSGGPK